MKFISLFFVLLITGFSYSQTYRPVDFGVETEISLCTNWEAPQPSRDGFVSPQRCIETQICSLQLYTTEEPVVVSCSCYARHSTKHPEYEPHSDNFPSVSVRGVHEDRNAAEEEARAICTHRFNSTLEGENPEHWVTSIDCGTEYRYLCEDGSIEMRRAGAPF